MLPVFFAPLQGFTESSYRQAHFLYAGGIEAYYAPFLRVEKGDARSKDLRDLQQDVSPTKNGTGYKVIPQIICKDATEFNILVATIEKLGFDEIDINMGCPFPMQAKSGRGSGILPRIDAVKEILREIENHALLKFSVKMRLGYDSPEDCLALLPLLNDAPLTHITMHPRLGIQQYKGALDFDGFQKFYKDCRHPVIFNGDITTVAGINSVEKMFPNLKGIMIGRGLLADPTLALQYQTQSPQDTLGTLLKIHDAILNDYRKRLQGDSQILDKIRPFWTYAALEKRIQKKIEKARNLDSYIDAVSELGH